MRRATAAGLLVALALAGCGGGEDGGGGSSSAADYRVRLDAGCAKLTGVLAGLPQRQQREDLEIADLQRIADDASRENLADVKALDPPEALADAHAELVDLLEGPASPGDLAALRARTQRFKAAFDRLGAKGCATSAQRTLDGLPGG